MNLSRIVASMALAILIGLIACSNPSSPPAAPQSAAKSPVPPAAPSTPAAPATSEAAGKGSLWKSQTTGNEYRVWTEKDEFHAEWANVLPQLAARGAHISSMAKHKGKKWVGESEEYLPCTVGEGNQAHLANFCKLTTGFEIDSMSATQIKGRGEYKRISDCAKCVVSIREWKDFVWVPKK